MKKVILGTLALVMALAMTLPVAGAAMAQPESATDAAPAAKPALAIKAPDVARVGQLVTIKVVERHVGRPVYKAGVWAVDVKDIISDTDDSEDYASLAEKYGHFLGWTDKKGNVSHRFREPGQYMLVAVKNGFVPGFAKITIKPLRALAIRAPEAAWVGQLVTIKVIEKHIHKPVPRAAVFAINVKDIVNQADDAETYAEIAKRKGYFIGLTDRNGEVTHRFRVAGRYVLVTVKDGFIPGFAKIAIKPLQPAEPVPLAVPE